jgi:hypothetical protein
MRLELPYEVRQVFKKHIKAALRAAFMCLGFNDSLICQKSS